MAQFNHTGETNNLDGDLSITILYTHIYTHAHTHIPVVLQIAHHHIHTYIYTYAMFHQTEWSICFTGQIAHHYAYIYIHIYSVSPHRVDICFTSHMAQFTTLGKPTIWMVTYLSPPYTPTCTHIHTNILFVLQITHHHTHAHIYIYRYILCFTTQS